MPFDLHAYLARIGFTGATRPTLATLAELHHAHVCAIPFENLDVLLDRPVHLETEAIQEKLVVARRGGYCYEQNALFLLALQQMGFDARGLAARVVIAQPPSVPPRTHMLLLVQLEEAFWIADVGFGGPTLSAPIRLLADQVQSTPHGDYQLQSLGEEWLLCQRHHAEWLPLYRFDLVTQFPSDYLMANHFVSTWPHSHFRHHLLAARYLPDGGQLALENRRFSRYGTQPERRTLDDLRALYQLLQDEFRLGVKHSLYGISEEEFIAAMARLEQAQ
ncbi:MAG: arylamine N-acetyltransferase [Pantoea sp.]|nr:arylamine N-acetyltransferase [Pantoea sp.]